MGGRLMGILSPDIIVTYIFFFLNHATFNVKLSLNYKIVRFLEKIYFTDTGSFYCTYYDPDHGRIV